MLYTQCSVCRAIGPLMCAGTMFPHVPLPTVRTPYGATCPGCSSVMTGFLCPCCLTAQYLLVPGVPAPTPAPRGGSQAYAPVVQAGQGASTSMLKSVFKEATTSFAHEFGAVLAQAAFGQNTYGDGSNWQQSWGQW